jgi:hypothetical protein
MRSVFARGAAALSLVALLGVAALGCGGGSGIGDGFAGPAQVSPAKSTVTANVASVKADGTSTAVVTVVLEDGNGNPIKDALIEATVTGTNNLVTISGITDATGTATVAIASTKGETKTVTITAINGTNPGVTLTETVTITFVAVATAPAGSTIIASAPSAVADGVSTVTLTVTVEDVLGNPVPDQTVAFATTTGTNVSLTVAGVATGAVTNASGVATATVSSPTAQTGVIVTASVFSSAGGATITLASPPIAFTPGPAAALRFSSLPTFVAGVPNTIVVTFVDAQGNATASNQEVALNIPTIASNNGSLPYNRPLIGPNFVFAFGNTIVVARNGVATFSGLGITVGTGTYTVGAQATGFAPITGTFTAVGNTATSLIFEYGTSLTADDTVNAPSTVVQGQPFNPVVEVFAVDTFNNKTATLPSGVGTVTISGTAALTGTLTRPLVGGVATFGGLGVDVTQAVGAAFTLSAVDDGAVLTATGNSNAFSVVATLLAAQLRIPQVPNLTAGIASPLLTATLVDSTGAAASPTNGPVTFALTAVDQFGNTISLGNQTTGSSFTIQIDKVGSYSLRTTNTGDGANVILDFLTTAAPTTGAGATTPFTVSPAAPAQLVFTQNPGLGNAIGALVSNTGTTLASAMGVITSPTPDLQVTCKDAFGNVATTFSGSNAVVQVLMTGGAPGTAVLGATTATAVAGVANFGPLSLTPGATNPVNNTATPYILTASPAVPAAFPGLVATAVNPTFNIVAAGNALANAAKVVFLNPPTNATAGDQIPASGATPGDLVLQLQDFYGTPILNLTQSASISQLAGSGIGTDPAPVTDLVPALATVTASTTAPITTAPANAHFQGQFLHQDRTCITLFLVATSGGLNNGLSGPIDILPGIAENVVPPSTALSFTPNQPAPLAIHAQGNLAFPTILTPAGSGTGLPYVQVFDALGNVATTFNGTCSATLIQAALPANAGTLGGTTTVSFVSGNAIFFDLGITANSQAFGTTVAYPGLNYAIPQIPGFASLDSTNGFSVTSP